MQHELTRLQNGVRVHLIPFEGTEAVTVLVLIRVGSRYEYKEISGAAHFIEHLMFKGTDRRPSTLDISRQLDSVGAQYNAYTGKDLTGYYIKMDAKHGELAVDLLHDMLFHSKYDPEEMDRERGVIIEEINMYKDNPIMHVEELLEAQLFEGNTLGWNIAGSHETMRGMTREQVIAYRDAYYTPSRLVVAVAGKIDVALKANIEATFGSIAPAAQEGETFVPFAFPEILEGRIGVDFRDTNQVQMMLGFPGYSMNHQNKPAAKLMATILGGTMSSRLFISVRERKGLAYMVRASHDSYEDIGVLTIQSGLDRSRLKEAMKTIREELQNLAEHGVTESELKEAKDHIAGKTLLSLEDSSDRAEWYARQELFLNEAKSPQERMQEYAAVSREDIARVAKEVFNEKRMAIAAIGPYKSKEAFIAEAGL